MIYDCFTYNGENSCLDIRMDELSGLGIIHVIAQSNRTFTGNERKVYEIKYDNCINIIVEDMPDNCDTWTREAHQRNAIMRGLTNANDNDVIIIADADEIPKLSSVKSYNSDMGIASFRMDNFWYKLNCLTERQTWIATKILTYSQLKDTKPDLIRRGGQETMLDYGGWHFSYLGDAKFISNKLQSFSHTEYNTEDAKNLSEIQRKIDNGLPLWGDTKFEYIELCELPKYVYENHGKFKHLIKEI